MLGDGGTFGSKRKKEEADLDITPMIDVTFLLLIFFMVTSTMQGTPDKDIPPSKSGTNTVAAGKIDVAILAPKSSGEDGQVVIDDRTMTLDQFKEHLMTLAGGQDRLDLLIYAERNAKNGFIGEVEGIMQEVATEAQVTVEGSVAVRDRKD